MWSRVASCPGYQTDAAPSSPACPAEGANPPATLLDQGPSATPKSSHWASVQVSLHFPGRPGRQASEDLHRRCSICCASRQQRILLRALKCLRCSLHLLEARCTTAWRSKCGQPRQHIVLLPCGRHTNFPGPIEFPIKRASPHSVWLFPGKSLCGPDLGAILTV